MSWNGPIGLTSLSLWSEGEARASYFRIFRFSNLTQRGNSTHLNFSRDTVLENMLNMITDTVISRYLFEKKFAVNGKDENIRVSVRDLSGIQTGTGWRANT